MEIKNKNIIITGGAHRLGKEISLALAKKGANIIFTYNKSADLAKETLKTIKTLKVKTIALKVNNLKVNEIKNGVKKIYKQFSQIDVLINSAAIFYETPILKIIEKDWDNFLDINLKATFFWCKFVGEKMLKKSGGKIINIADVSAFKPWTNFIPYCVSKAGVVTITKVLAKTLAPKITVNAICPGAVLLPEHFTKSEIKNSKKITPLKRIGTQQDIIKAVIFLIESDYLTGIALPVDGGRLIN